MLTQDVILALLQASVTGAGLVLAVYTLFTPKARRFFERRARLLNKELSELKEKTSKKKSYVTEEEIEELESLLTDIKKHQAMPQYLVWGVHIAFFGYVASTLLSIGWILDYQNYQATYDNILPFAFVCSTIVFFITGFWIVKELNETMKEEFEELKKKVEETKSRTDIIVDKTSLES